MKTLREKLDAAAASRRQVLHGDRRRARVRLAAARPGVVPGAAVPRLRQHHVLRPARLVEQVRRPERGAVRQRRRRRSCPPAACTARTRTSATSTPTGRTTTSAAPCSPAGSTSACRTTRAAGAASPAAPTACGRAALPDQTKARRAPAGDRLDHTVRQRRGRHRQPVARRRAQRPRSRPAPTRCGTRKNLQEGRTGDYLEAYGLTPATDPEDRITGTYTRNYSSALVAPWLWNAQKQVFLSTEDDQSLGGQGRLRREQGHRRHHDLGARRRLRLGHRPATSTSSATR